ncbi:hypothetical protein LXL04_019933 [Taraxacum kok-saghyz]
MSVVNSRYRINEREEVEVNRFRRDRRLCFYIGTINCLFQTVADVLFTDLKAEDGQPLLDRVCLEFLRPKPAVFVYDYKCGDAVEIWENDRWYKGKFIAISYRLKVYCQIYRAEGEEGIFWRKRDVRPSQKWCLKDGASVWKHRRLVRGEAFDFNN